MAQNLGETIKRALATYPVLSKSMLQASVNAASDNLEEELDLLVNEEVLGRAVINQGRTTTPVYFLRENWERVACFIEGKIVRQSGY